MPIAKGTKPATASGGTRSGGSAKLIKPSERTPPPQEATSAQPDAVEERPASDGESVPHRDQGQTMSPSEASAPSVSSTSASDLDRDLAEDLDQLVERGHDSVDDVLGGELEDVQLPIAEEDTSDPAPESLAQENSSQTGALPSSDVNVADERLSSAYSAASAAADEAYVQKGGADATADEGYVVQGAENASVNDGHVIEGDAQEEQTEGSRLRPTDAPEEAGSTAEPGAEVNDPGDVSAPDVAESVAPAPEAPVEPKVDETSTVPETHDLPPAAWRMTAVRQLMAGRRRAIVLALTTLLALPLRALPRSLRPMMDWVAISLVFWVPIVWVLAFVLAG